MIALNELIPDYNFLNKIYNDIINKQRISFVDQQFITDFFNKFSDSVEFESTIIDSIQESKYINVLLKSLNSEIEISIEIYQKNRAFFDEVNTKEICLENAKRYNFTFELQLKTVKEYSKDFDIANNALEGTAYQDISAKEIGILTKDYNRKKELYYIERNKLDDIYQDQIKLENFSFKYCQNKFNDIYEISNTKMNILKKYLNSNIEDNEYFDLILIGKIYKISNRVLFDAINQLDFYNEFNLNNTFSKLKIIKNQKNKLYYVVYKLNLTLNSDNNWLTHFLEKMELNINTYKSKYKDIIRDDADKTLKEFVKVINDIFDNKK